MSSLRKTFAVGLLTALMSSTSPAPAQASGAYDFDFLFGEWRVHHRVKRPIVGPEWSEFDGTCRNRGLIDGSANVEEHRFDRPAGVTYGIAIRAYDSKTAQWAIWWIDSRAPHGAMDPPVVGRFEKGVGTFYSDGTLDGSRSACGMSGPRSRPTPPVGSRPIQWTRERLGKPPG